MAVRKTVTAARRTNTARRPKATRANARVSAKAPVARRTPAAKTPTRATGTARNAAAAARRIAAKRAAGRVTKSAAKPTRKTTTARTTLAKRSAAPARRTASIKPRLIAGAAKGAAKVSSKKPGKTTKASRTRRSTPVADKTVLVAPVVTASTPAPRAPKAPRAKKVQPVKRSAYADDDEELTPEKLDRLERELAKDVEGTSAEDSYKMFVREVKTYRILSREEEEKLAIRMEGADRDARAELVNHNLRLVIAQAKHYRRQGVAIMDLIQEGTIGLMRAVDKFDYRLGNKFSTYATWWIRQSINRAISNRAIRLPVHAQEEMQKLKRTSGELAQEMGREPTVKEVSERLAVHRPGWSEQRVEEVTRLSQEAMSLEAPIGEDGEASLADLIEDKNIPQPEEVVSDHMLKEQIAAILDSLTNRERMVLQLRYGLVGDGRPRTLEEVGREFGVTRERIRQIEARALRKLQRPGRVRHIRDYYDG